MSEHKKMLLDVRELTVAAPPEGKVTLLSVSFLLEHGESLAIVGESGSGKSTLLRAIVGLLPPSFTVSGEVHFISQNLLSTTTEALRTIRRRDIRFVFQEPLLSLNPVAKVKKQLTLAHPDCKAEHSTLVKLLEQVGLSEPQAILEHYPHELSIGMAQRVALAMALLPNPSLIIADEPTSALDPLVRIQLMEVLCSFTRQSGRSLLFVTHDLLLARRFADRIVVLRDGRVVESAPADQLFHSPRHAYTRQLLAASPLIPTGQQ